MKKHNSLLLLVVMLALVAGSASAAPIMRQGGDGLGNTVGGICDSAPDADGDGIPNGQDPDYTPPADGTGSKFGKPVAVPAGAQARIQADSWFRFMWLGGLGPIMTGLLSSGYGPGDGTGDGDGPADGTGYGPGDGTGDCDGTGVFLRTHRP